MTTSSSSPQRGLDAGPIIYSLLSGHPASAICEIYIRGHSGWFTTAVTLLEVDAVLRKVYGVDPMLAAGKLAQFVVGPIVISAVRGIYLTQPTPTCSVGGWLKIIHEH